MENVTVEDITAEADVSLRTFGNYFSSKYEAITTRRWGSLGDRYGRKGALQIGLVGFAGFSAFAGLRAAGTC